MTFSFIFDMDGTLFQTDKILEQSLHGTFNHLRNQDLWDQETPLEKYREIMGVTLPEVWGTLLPTHSHEIRHEANKVFHDLLIENIRAGVGALYPNVEVLFNDLKKRDIPIYIASNGQTEYLKAIVKYYQLDQWVTETFSIQEINSSNKGDLIKSILVKYNIEKAVVVGDRLSDIMAAKNNGLFSIGCRFDFANENELSQADKIIDHLLEIYEFLPSLENMLLDNHTVIQR